MRISLEKALELINEKTAPLPEQTLPLEKALGCVAARDIFAAMDQPPFPRSPYDGYALRAEDSAGAGRKAPVTLKVVGRSFAGIPADCEVRRGEAVRIMTGGVIPRGADCVIMQEKTDEGEETVNIYDTLVPFANYCRAGEDFKEGERLIAAGTPINAPVLAVAACSGYSQLTVFPRPRAAVIATGDELRTVGEKLGPGQIYSSNSVMLSCRLAELGAEMVNNSIVIDDLPQICAGIDAAAQQADMVITTGGVSVGQHDLVPAALERLGAEMVFHGVDIKPGMPTALAVYKGVPVLALSGNPFAADVAFELLGRPLLARLASDVRLAPPVAMAPLAEDFGYHRNMRRFLRARLIDGRVYLPKAQGNGQIRTMIGCSCLAELPSGEGALAAESPVKLYLLDSFCYGFRPDRVD